MGKGGGTLGGSGVVGGSDPCCYLAVGAGHGRRWSVRLL